MYQSNNFISISAFSNFISTKKSICARLCDPGKPNIMGPERLYFKLNYVYLKSKISFPICVCVEALTCSLACSSNRRSYSVVRFSACFFMAFTSLSAFWCAVNTRKQSQNQINKNSLRTRMNISAAPCHFITASSQSGSQQIKLALVFLKWFASIIVQRCRTVTLNFLTDVNTGPAVELF